MSQRVLSDGVSCERCGGRVRRREHPPGWEPRPGRTWFRWWFACEGCGKVWQVNEARVPATKAGQADQAEPIKVIATDMDKDELILSDVPVWPGYNGGRMFRCACGMTFERSVGYAKHQVYECASLTKGGVRWPSREGGTATRLANASAGWSRSAGEAMAAGSVGATAAGN
jgi:hypothetical protein